jgi:hypothetical protein
MSRIPCYAKRKRSKAVDLKKELKQFYAPKTVPSMVDLPPMPYLMVDGRGDPNSAPAFYEAIQSLYRVAYGIRAWSKAQGQVYSHAA